jgi:SAM-dependent methyltransferase
VIARPLGWDHPDTARYYARFQRRFARYRQANRRLVRHATLAPGMRVLDVAAGDGATAAEVLSRVGGDGAVLCLEPAACMRALGERRLRDARVTWTAAWPTEPGSFDRIVCGAALWQLLPVARTLRTLFELLRPGGCLSFDIPALYLGEADAPGGGRDPLLLGVPAALAARIRPRCHGGGSPGTTMDVSTFEVWLAAAGFRADRWSFSIRLGQRAYREWLKIPPTTDALLIGLTADERSLLIDEAFATVDASSWRWERWLGWTAWRPGP